MFFDEQRTVFPDENDVDEYGMDIRARKRMGLTKRGKALKKNVKAMNRNVMPMSLRFHEDSSLRKRSYLLSKDPIKSLFMAFMRLIPEFQKSRVGNVQASGSKGYLAQGSWPTSGRQIFDWELELWQDKKDFILKYNLWSAKGKNAGDSYRLSPSRMQRFMPKFIGFVNDSISEMKRDAKDN